MNLSARYWKMPTYELRKLQSKKRNRISSLESKELGYFDVMEIRKLKGHLKWIDAVLASRDAQLDLPETK